MFISFFFKVQDSFMALFVWVLCFHSELILKSSGWFNGLSAGKSGRRVRSTMGRTSNTQYAGFDCNSTFLLYTWCRSDFCKASRSLNPRIRWLGWLAGSHGQAVTCSMWSEEVEGHVYLVCRVLLLVWTRPNVLLRPSWWCFFFFLFSFSTPTHLHFCISVFHNCA